MIAGEPAKNSCEVLGMANLCDFSMRITGGEAEILEMIQMMRWDGPFREDGLGRIFELGVGEMCESGVAGIFEVECWGDCAWSIKSSMREDGYRSRSLESETKRLGLVVEAYSSEPGHRFQEHILFAKGEVVVDDCVDYEEHWVDECSSLDEYNRLNGTSFTPDMVNDNGEVCIGGFGDEYGDFHDVSEYFALVAPAITVPQEMEVCGLYELDDEFASIVKAPNGRYFNYYSKDGFTHGYGSAGPFDTFEHAEEMLMRHRPAAKRHEGLDARIMAARAEKTGELKPGVGQQDFLTSSRPVGDRE